MLAALSSAAHSGRRVSCWTSLWRVRACASRGRAFTTRTPTSSFSAGCSGHHRQAGGDAAAQASPAPARLTPHADLRIARYPATGPARVHRGSRSIRGFDLLEPVVDDRREHGHDGTIDDVIKSAKALGRGALISKAAARERIAPTSAGLPGFSRNTSWPASSCAPSGRRLSARAARGAPRAAARRLSC